VVKEGRPDPNNPKSAVADLEYLCKLDPPTTLHEVKASKMFDEFALVRQSRLSTMAVPKEFVEWVKARYPKSKF
jgi:predicted RNA-binding protein with PUA-like domain